MALYVGDYQRDTKHLSCCEHGIYLQLLMHCWSTKSPLPVEDRLICTIPLLGEKVANVYSSFCDTLSEAYPAVDVPQTLKEIKVWNETRPKKRKTSRGIEIHIQNWCAREQNRG
jgi:hypothetical protein